MNSTTDATEDSPSFTLGLSVLDLTTEDADSSGENCDNFQEVFECEVELEPLESLPMLSLVMSDIITIGKEGMSVVPRSARTTNVVSDSYEEITMPLRDQPTASRSTSRGRGNARSRGASRSRSSSRKSTSRGPSKTRRSSTTSKSRSTRGPSKSRGASKSRSRSRSAQKPSASRRGRRM